MTIYLQNPYSFKSANVFMHSCKSDTASEVSKYGVLAGPYFPVFGLNMDIYGVNLRIQSECKKIQTRKNSVFGHFSYSERHT